jgi:hypothetical protein
MQQLLKMVELQVTGKLLRVTERLTIK